jgi:hypothetical protein
VLESERERELGDGVSIASSFLFCLLRISESTAKQTPKQKQPKNSKIAKLITEAKPKED